MKMEPFNPADLDYFPPGELFPLHKARFALIAFDKIAVDTTPAYLVKGIIPRVGLCVFWGPPKCGKSFLVFDLMMHIALGWQYRGRRVRQGAVVYCALEGCAAFKNRIEAFRQRKLAENSSEVPFHLMASPIGLVADHAALIASIRATLGTVLPAAIAIDTLNRSLAGSESDDRDMAAYVKVQSETPSTAPLSSSTIAAMKERVRAATARLWAPSMRKSPSNAMPQTISSPR
jgi:hypothetical protein